MMINDSDCLNKLPLQSYIRTHKIFTIHNSLIISKLTSVKVDFRNKIVDKIIQLIK